MTASQLNVTAGTAYLRQSSDNSLRRRSLASSTQSTSGHPSATMFLDLNSDGTWSFATTHSVDANALTIATVTTDASSNIATITDTRLTASTMLTGMEGILTLPRVAISAVLTAATKLIDLLQGYGLFSDNTGANGTTRLWFDSPDRGEAHIGPRASANFLDWFRARATRVTLELGRNASPNATLFQVTGGPTQLDNAAITTDGNGNLSAASLKEGTTRVAVQGSHSAGQPLISYGTGVPASLAPNEIYIQLS